MYLQNNVSLAHNKTNDGNNSFKQMGIKKESLLSQIVAVCEYIDQQ
jgi:hypothetical protein